MAHPNTSQRRTQVTTRGTAIFVRPVHRMDHKEWSAALEQRALLAGMVAVIGGVVCEPGSPQAEAALARMYAPHMEGGAA